ncbi:MAG: amidohydrolase [Deltaproteobacteria bacterium]
MNRARIAGVFAGFLVFGCASQPTAVTAQPDKDQDKTVLPLLGDRSPRSPYEAVLPARPKPAGVVAITGGTVFTGDGKKIEDGTVVFSNGKITAVGKGVKVPKGALVVDAAGKFVTPGLIDTHSHMGVYAVPHVGATADGNEMTDPTTPYVFSEHAFWPQDPAIQHAVAGGVTTIQVLPGSGNVIGGRAATLKLRPRLEARAMRFDGAPFGLKMACGENPKRVYGQMKKSQPMSRMGSIFKLRNAFIQAREYKFDQDAYEAEYAEWKKKYDAYQADDSEPAPGKEPRRPSRNLGHETLADVMDGKIKVHIHCYRADEMIQMIALGKELGFKVSSFHHAVEAYKIADVLAKEGVGASMWADWWGFKLEAYDGVEENIAMVHAAGGNAIVHSDSNIGIQRLNQEASKALASGRRAGLEIEDADAIRWVTSNPAKALGVDDKTGTLKSGMMADVVVWDKDPLSIYSQAELVFIDGERVFDRAKKPEAWSDFEVGTASEEVRP